VETSVHVFSVYVNKSHNAVQVDLIELLDSNDQAIRGSAVGVLADIAQEHPDIVVDLAGALAGRLSDASEAARTNASIALNRAGETDSQTTRTQGQCPGDSTRRRDISWPVRLRRAVRLLLFVQRHLFLGRGQAAFVCARPAAPYCYLTLLYWSMGGDSADLGNRYSHRQSPICALSVYNSSAY